MDRQRLTVKICIASLLTALALISFMIESLFPPIIIPGARLGISNVFILTAVLILNWKYAFAVLIIKCLLGSIFSGNVSSLLYSLPAGLISLTVECLLLRVNRFSILSVSVVGSVINLTVQNTVFCLITKTYAYLVYLPYLALIGSISGAVIGATVYLINFIVTKKERKKSYRNG